MAKLIEITGKALSGEWGNDDNTGNGILVLRTTNFTNEGIVNYNNVVTRIIEKKKIEEKYLRKGDIIIEKSGGSDKQPVGRVVYFDGPENTYLFNNFTGLLRVKDQAKWYPRYVFYSLFSNYHRGGTRAFQNKTTGLHNLKIDDFVSRCEVTEAGINEQIAACKQMDRVNDIIRMHQQQLQKLDEIVKARFIELFGDPVRNSMGLPTEPMTTVCAIIDGDRGKNYPKQDEFSDTGYCLFLNAKNVTATGFSFENRMFITKEKDNALHNGKLERGDVVLTTRGTLGNLAFYDDSVPFENVRINSGMVILRMNKSVMTEVFFMEQFKLQLQSIKGKIASGSAQPQLPISTMNKIRILLAPMALQEQFAAFVEQTDKSKVAVQKALDETQLLFDSLMQKFFGYSH